MLVDLLKMMVSNIILIFFGVCYIMKKQMLIMLLSALCATSSAMAMEIMDLDAEPVGKRYAVVSEQELDYDYCLNYHVETSQSQKGHISQDAREKNSPSKLFVFEIENFQENNNIIAFPIVWDNVQYFTHDFLKLSVPPYPWMFVNSNYKNYRVVESYAGVLRIDTSKERPFNVMNANNAYYPAIVYATRQRSKQLFFHFEDGSNVGWDLKNPRGSFNPDQRRQESVQDVLRHTEANQDEAVRAFQLQLQANRAELRTLVSEAVYGKKTLENQNGDVISNTSTSTTSATL